MASYYQNRKLYGYVEDEITRMLRFMRDYTTIKEFIELTAYITSPRVLREKYERVKRDVEKDIIDGLRDNEGGENNTVQGHQAFKFDSELYFSISRKSPEIIY